LFFAESGEERGPLSSVRVFLLRMRNGLPSPSPSTKSSKEEGKNKQQTKAEDITDDPEVMGNARKERTRSDEENEQACHH